MTNDFFDLPEDEHRYDDIIGLPHHVSPDRKHMSDRDRAAQFSPFAALTGYEDSVKEAARLTDKRPEPDDDQKALLDSRMNELMDSLPCEAELTYFLPDKNKSGGAVVTVCGIIRLVDEYEKMAVFTDGRRIPTEDILGIRLL